MPTTQTPASGNVFVIQPDGGLSELVERPYDSEALLQHLLAQHPRLIAGDLIDSQSPRRWMLVTRELALSDKEDGAGRWSVDHLFLDQDGVPTIVEVKRSSDTRIRREVVGQILEYAANAVAYWPVESLRARFETRCAEQHLDPSAEVQRLTENPGIDSSKFWELVKTNLQAGKVRLILVADVIPAELRRIVEFLNRQMDPAEILAVEIRQFASGDLRTLVPRVFGKVEPPPVAGRKWDAESFFNELSIRNPSLVPVAREIHDWTNRRCTRLLWGSGVSNGSMISEIEGSLGRYQLLAVWTSGSVEIYFQWLKGKLPFSDLAMRQQLAEKLNRIPGVSIDGEALSKRPSVPLSSLLTVESRHTFFAAIDWCASQIERTIVQPGV